LTDPERAARWDRRHAAARVEDAEPARVLVDYAHLLPDGGLALDLACGLGGNAVYLAEQGFKTFAWDLSPVAVDKLAAWSRDNLLSITAEVRDALAAPPEPQRFDVVVVSRFLDRSLALPLMRSLRPGGLLYYQTFTRDPVNPERGPGDPAFRLAANELLELFGALRVLAYRDEGRVGNRARGVRDEALLVAQRPGQETPLQE
jgi:SAM-dependent methyltransferase